MRFLCREACGWDIQWSRKILALSYCSCTLGRMVIRWCCHCDTDMAKQWMYCRWYEKNKKTKESKTKLFSETSVIEITIFHPFFPKYSFFFVFSRDCLISLIKRSLIFIVFPYINQTENYNVIWEACLWLQGFDPKIDFCKSMTLSSIVWIVSLSTSFTDQLQHAHAWVIAYCILYVKQLWPWPCLSGYWLVWLLLFDYKSVFVSVCIWMPLCTKHKSVQVSECFHLF